MYKVVVSKQAVKDFNLIKQAGYGHKVQEMIEIVGKNPFQTPPRYEKLSRELRGYYSRRINDQHRFVYEVLPNDDNLKDENEEPYLGIVKIIRMWTHYK